MREVRSIVVLSALLIACGCSLTVPIDEAKPSKPDAPSVEHALPEDVWPTLARAVESGWIETPFQLAQYVKALQETGDLSEADQDNFDKAFPKASKDHSAIDAKAASATLKCLK